MCIYGYIYSPYSISVLLTSPTMDHKEIILPSSYPYLYLSMFVCLACLLSVVQLNQQCTLQVDTTSSVYGVCVAMYATTSLTCTDSNTGLEVERILK